MRGFVVIALSVVLGAIAFAQAPTAKVTVAEARKACLVDHPDFKDKAKHAELEKCIREKTGK